jgi:nucleotide-binding universal stress UspA family protein
VYLLKGEAERLIPELAKAREVELIVMGTVCRTGLAGFLIGNTAEKVLRQVDCSVLTIKPDGFITPVKLDV